MANRLVTILSAAVLLAVASCAPKGGKSLHERPFPTVEIPALYSEPQVRLEYNLTHFWDAVFDGSEEWLTDSLHLAGIPREEFEENFALFSSLLRRASVKVGDNVMEALFRSVAGFRSDSLKIMTGDEIIRLADKYLYDSSSPLRCEDAYYRFAVGLADSDIVPDSMREHYRTAARNCSMNRRGTRAADFTFKDAQGHISSLYGIKAPYILVKIQNLECTACRELQSAMEESPKIQYLLSKGTVVQIDVPAEGDIETKYDVRAIPSLYILDKDKTVLAKDASSEYVLAFLENLRD